MESLFPDVQSSTTEEPTTINLLASKSIGQRLKCKLPTVLAPTAGDNVEVVQSFTYHGVEIQVAFSALRLLVGRQEGHPACKKQSGGVLVWLSVWGEVQTCIWPS